MHSPARREHSRGVACVFLDVDQRAALSKGREISGAHVRVMYLYLYELKQRFATTAQDALATAYTITAS